MLLSLQSWIKRKTHWISTAGVGTITLELAKYCRQAVGVEIVERAVQDARLNARENQIENVRFLVSDAGPAARRLAQEGFWPEVIVCDPPRKGLDQSAVDAILTLRPKRVIYVSCDCATMSRDIKKLGETYTTDNVTAFDLFPRTANVECVVLLSMK